jgi:hypothetical protein
MGSARVLTGLLSKASGTESLHDFPSADPLVLPYCRRHRLMYRRRIGNQILVKAQQMMSACDIALRGYPGNTFSSILRNRDFERRPLHARHMFLFVMHPMLVLFI